jgi:hypothetical protein
MCEHELRPRRGYKGMKHASIQHKTERRAGGCIDTSVQLSWTRPLIVHGGEKLMMLETKTKGHDVCTLRLLDSY